MWELEREANLPDLTRLRCAIVGPGRLGRALAAALREAGLDVEGPHGRGWTPGAEASGPAAGGPAGAAGQSAGPAVAGGLAGPDVVLLCVPDEAIPVAAAAIAPGPLVGHCSGSRTLDALAPHAGFSLHPLMSVPAEGPARLAGAFAAVAGADAHAEAVATALAYRLGLAPVAVADADRAAYHAAASIASNFLVTLEAAAERLAESAGVERAALVPLVRATVENWASLGPQRALTGPLVRGDEATVARQRAALAERAPELVELFDALADATRALARAGSEAVPA